MEPCTVKLNYYDYSWPLSLTNCPCDLHFTQYLESRKVEGKLIFHFGPGKHHMVGKDNFERGNPNEIIAITASYEEATSRSGEHDAYIDFIVDNPAAANCYKVLFADIYTLSPRLLPSFDIVTLFHLCEYYDEQYFDGRKFNRLNSSYARLDDAGLLEMFLSKLNIGGKIFFFTKSGGFIHGDRRAAKIVDDYVSQRKLVIEDEYETLLICGRPVNENCCRSK